MPKATPLSILAQAADHIQNTRAPLEGGPGEEVVLAAASGRAVRHFHVNSCTHTSQLRQEVHI